jgi:hypothetical protein
MLPESGFIGGGRQICLSETTRQESINEVLKLSLQPVFSRILFALLLTRYKPWKGNLFPYSITGSRTYEAVPAPVYIVVFPPKTSLGLSS